MNCACQRGSASCRSSSIGSCTGACGPRRPVIARAFRASFATSSKSVSGRSSVLGAHRACCSGSADSPTASSRPSTWTASSMAAERIVVDTWGWLSLADDREPRHRHVRQVVAELGRAAGTAVTTDYILDETLTLVFRRLPFARARRFMATLDTAEQDGSVSIEAIGAERFASAKTLRLRFRDK